MKVSDYLQRTASKNWLLKTFLGEWQAIILIVLLIKLTTSFISIFSGFYYFKNLLLNLFNNERTSIVFAVVILALIELLANYLLSKFFKFALRVKLATASIILIFVVGVYSLSWQSSCRGIELYQTRNTDHTTEIVEDYTLQENQLREELKLIIDENQQAISNIEKNPQVWKNGERVLLSEEQQKLIAEHYRNIQTARNEFGSKLENLKNERKNAIFENNSCSSAEGKKYYWVVAIVMICQVVCTGVLWFCYSKIAIEKDKQLLFSENLQVIDEDLNHLIKGRTIQVFSLYKSALANMFAQTTPEEYNISFASNENQSAKLNAQTTKKGIGFNTEKTDNTAPVPTENNACLQCGKTFEKTRENKKFCSTSCRIAHHNATSKRQINIKPNNMK